MTRLQVPVDEFTTPNPVTAPETASIDELRKLMLEHGVRHLPIVRDRQVVGIISDRDLKVVASLDNQEKFLVQASDIMAPDPFTVRSDQLLADVAFEMSKRKIGSVIVNDENDEFLGIFTATDALNALIEIARGMDE